MKHTLLLPNIYKKIGWWVFIPATIMGILLISFDSVIEINATVFAIYADDFFGSPRYFSFIKTDIAYTLIGALVIIGGMLVGFSREKNEDEYIASLRLNSLLWAVLVNYVLLLIMFLFVYGLGFLSIMMYNIFTCTYNFYFQI